MKYYIIAGEASGDLHGANLIQELRKADREAQFCFLGGDMMAEASDTPPVIHYRQMAFMGIVTVLLHLRTVLRNLKTCKQSLLAFSPDVVILIDYPSFNLRMAKFAKKAGLKVFYYISPKLWAWKEYRIKHIKALVDNMFCIFPFEIDFYQKHNYHKTLYVGNPLVDAIENRPSKNESFEAFVAANALSRLPIVALLAGSRKKEVADNLPLMLSVIPHFPQYQFVIAGAPGLAPEFYETFLSESPAKIVFGQTYALLQQSSAAMVTSGTATLETALLNVPQAVTYNMELGRIVPYLYRLFIHTPYFSLVNIIAGKPVVKELLGAQVTTPALMEELDRLLNLPSYRNAMLEEYQLLKKKMGESGASGRAAAQMVSILRQ